MAVEKYIIIFKPKNLKLLFRVLLLLCCSGFSYAQNKADSLSRLISKAASDTQRINLMVEKINALASNDMDSAIVFGKSTIEEAKRTSYKKGEANARIMVAFAYCFKGEFELAKEHLDISKIILSQVHDSIAVFRLYDNYGIMYSMQGKYDTAHTFYQKAIAVARLLPDKSFFSTVCENIAIAYQQQSNYPQALIYYQEALKAADQVHDEESEAYTYLNMAITFTLINDNARAVQSFFKAIELAKKLKLKVVEAYAYSNLSSAYGDLKNFEKEYEYGIKAASLAKEIGDQGIQASSLSRAAMALAYQKNFKEAEKLSLQSMIIADSSKQPINIYQAYAGMGAILKMQSKYSEAIPYFEKAFRFLTDADLYGAEVGKDYSNLSECYEKTGNYRQSLAAYKLSSKITDSIRNKDNIRKATELTLNYEFAKKQQIAKIEQEKKDAITKRIKNQQYFIITALGIVVLAVLIIVFIQFRNNKQKQKANFLLERQKLKVENTLSELKSTQAQLIQSEKMASLGELTAGIAHEIQNPLNFVNNFSELNKELLTEMKDEMDKGDIAQARMIASDVIDNEEKITHHGKRADAIVKNMLQHSRSSSRQKELTDINLLADEYLRLSYHGLRAKDNSFNAIIKRDFDENIGTVNIIPQDIGRVLLNLYNNAFYACAERSRSATGERQRVEGVEYVPRVKVVTQKLNDKIELTVTDNGNGIPQKIIDKIFQPFFTTKPTGEGIGLGLSLSYDIIKAHGGDIFVRTSSEKTEAGLDEARAGTTDKGTEFTIHLPVT